jgi:hypothetical protein
MEEQAIDKARLGMCQMLTFESGRNLAAFTWLLPHAGLHKHFRPQLFSAVVGHDVVRIPSILTQMRDASLLSSGSLEMTEKEHLRYCGFDRLIFEIEHLIEMYGDIEDYFPMYLNQGWNTESRRFPLLDSARD